MKYVGLLCLQISMLYHLRCCIMRQINILIYDNTK